MISAGVVIIGAGQHGLALGKLLMERGVTFVILEADDSVGARWRRHYDSLELFTPRRFSALPGLRLEGHQEGYAGKDEFADYLAAYATRFHLPIRTGERVMRIRKEGEAFAVETEQALYAATQVVVASGYGVPVLPETAFSGYAIHSSAYMNPASVPGKKALVVGNGNSASQIALELSKTRETHIAMREMPRMIPVRVLGKSFVWWSELLGLSRLPREKDYVVGDALSRALKARSLVRKPGLSSAERNRVTFDDGSSEEYDAVIFATGFRQDRSFITIPGAEREKNGISAVPGLFFAGLRNQLAGDSSNIHGARRVARFLADRIAPKVARSWG